MVSDVRDRSRALLRQEMADAAFDFCARRGFETVTVDDIATEIGISRATFFRYFASKEDAIIAAADGRRMPLGASLRSGGTRSGQSALRAVRADLEQTARIARADPERMRARLAMIGALPALRARLAADRASQGNELTETLAAVLQDATAAKVVAAAAMAAIGLGWSLWVDAEGSDLGDQFDRAFELIGSVSDVLLP